MKMPTPSYINGIDGLRAVAVLSVVIFHLNGDWLPGGFIGVDIFFVISGYVVTTSILGKSWKNATTFFLTFLSRRMSRILPALIACLLITAAFQALFIPKAWLNDTSFKSGIAAFFGLSNLALIYFNDGYFSPRSEFNPFTHTWSLGVEEQFYVIFAVIWWLTRNKSTSFLAVATITGLASLIYCAFATKNNVSHAYYLLPSRWWELLTGAVLAHVHFALDRGDCKKKSHSRIFLPIGISLIIISALTTNPKNFPFPEAILAIAGTAMSIHSLKYGCKSILDRALEGKVLVVIGRHSYSIYLWHWPIIVAFKWTIGLHTPFQYALCTLATLTFARISYKYIENPLRKRLPEILTAGRLVLYGSVFLSTASLLTLFIYKQQSAISLSATSDTSTWYSSITSQQRTEALDPTKNTIYVLGDSHAGMLSKAMQMLEIEFDIQTKIRNQPGCAIANLRTQPIGECREFIEKSVDQISKESKPGDIVILSSLRVQRTSDQWGLIEPDGANNSNEHNEAAFIEADTIIKKFTSAGLKVIISAPLPVYNAPNFRCSDFFNKSNPVCAPGLEILQKNALNHRAPALAMLHALSKENPELIVWDPFFDVCPNETCKANDPEPLFFDGDHLTAAGNVRILPSLRAAIEATSTKN